MEHLTELEYTDIECQFYMGTAAYRHKAYRVAAAHWEYVIDSPIRYEGEEQIKAMALSTMNFLLYQGLGVEENKDKAVANWIEAVSQGDFEARRHLGFAFSDDSYKKKDLVKALGWYESLFLAFGDIENLDESDRNIYQDAMDGAEKLRSQLSEGDVEKAISYAKSLL